MARKRDIRTYEQGSYPPKLIGEKSYDLSDEELADENEARQIEQIRAVLDEDWTSAQAIARLKLLIRRLLSKGILP